MGTLLLALCTVVIVIFFSHLWLIYPWLKVNLNGNQSSDDHGIVSWEWTRKVLPDSEKELAADTANMRTAQPTISNLEEGTYTFILKVRGNFKLCA